jgi:hypothetical protein
MIAVLIFVALIVIASILPVSTLVRRSVAGAFGLMMGFLLENGGRPAEIYFDSWAAVAYGVGGMIAAYVLSDWLASLRSGRTKSAQDLK